jgi:hypothetical protein
VRQPAVELKTESGFAAYHSLGTYAEILDRRGNDLLLKVRDSDTMYELENPEAPVVIEWRTLPGLALKAQRKLDNARPWVYAQFIEGGTVIVYNNKFEVTDASLSAQQTVIYPPSLSATNSDLPNCPVVSKLSMRNLDNIGIGVSGAGKFIFIEDHLWNRADNSWYYNRDWQGIHPKVLMGKKKMIISSYWSKKIWVVPLKRPQQAYDLKLSTRWLSLSADENTLLIEQPKHFFSQAIKTCVIDLLDRPGKRIGCFKQEFPLVDWSANRAFAINSDNRWSIYQIKPIKLIRSGRIEQGAKPLLIDERDAVLLVQHDATYQLTGDFQLIGLDNGKAIHAGSIAEISKSGDWLFSGYDVSYSHHPFTLLLNSNDTTLVPYVLEDR